VITVEIRAHDRFARTDFALGHQPSAPGENLCEEVGYAEGREVQRHGIHAETIPSPNRTTAHGANELIGRAIQFAIDFAEHVVAALRAVIGVGVGENAGISFAEKNRNAIDTIRTQVGDDIAN
jgi:hypothetical protein